MATKRRKKSSPESDWSGAFLLGFLAVVVLTGAVLSIANLLFPVVAILGTGIFVYRYNDGWRMHSIADRKLVLGSDALNTLEDLTRSKKIIQIKIEKLTAISGDLRLRGVFTRASNIEKRMKAMTESLNALQKQIDQIFYSNVGIYRDMKDRYTMVCVFMSASAAYVLSALLAVVWLNADPATLIPLLDLDAYQIFGIYQHAMKPFLWVITTTTLCTLITAYAAGSIFEKKHDRACDCHIDPDTVNPEEEAEDEAKDKAEAKDEDEAETEAGYREASFDMRTPATMEDALGVFRLTRATLNNVSLKRAFRVAMKQCHPDLFVTMGPHTRKKAEEQARRIIAAKDLLMRHVAG